MNPRTIDMINDWYDHLPDGYQATSSDSINELLGLIDNCVTVLNPDHSVWRELDECEDFVEFISVVSSYCNLESTQILAIFCLDRGLSNCQMEFHEEIYPEYWCSEVSTYRKLVS